MAIATLTVDLNASTARFAQAMDTASQKLEGLESQAKKTNSFLGDIGSTFGRGSDFTKTMKLLSGTGPIIGLSLAFNAVASALDGINKEMKKFAMTGALAWNEIEKSVMSSIPVIGQFGSALEGVLETYIEIRLRAKEGIPLPQGPAGAGAREQEKITASQKTFNDLQNQINAEQENVAASAHQTIINNINEELHKRIEAINAAKDAEAKAIPGGILSGGRQMDFAQADLDARRLAAAKKAAANMLPEPAMDAAVLKFRKDAEEAAEKQAEAAKKMAEAEPPMLEAVLKFRKDQADALAREANAKAPAFGATTQAARSFRFTEGFPGSNGMPAIQENTKALHELTREQREANRLKRGEKAQADAGPAFVDIT